MRLTPLAIALLLAYSGPAVASSRADTQQVASSSAVEEIPFTLRLNNLVLTQELHGLVSGETYYLPLRQLAEQLSLAIMVEGRNATGFIIKENRTFTLDGSTGSVLVDGRSVSVEPTRLLQRDNDLYVPLDLLTQWLPVSFAVNMDTLTVEATAREALPVQLRTRREQNSALLSGPTKPKKPEYRRVPDVAPLVSLPFIDHSSYVNFSGGEGKRATGFGSSTYLTSSLFGHDAAASLTTGTTKRPELRAVLTRTDPDSNLLGFLHANRYSIGNIVLPSVKNIMRPSSRGVGMTISNTPLNRPTSADTHTLSGSLQAGWDVELYYNGSLVGYQASRADGLYVFTDMPLNFGGNDFKLVFHGPQGQVHTETQTYLLEDTFNKEGEAFYSLAVQHDEEGRLRQAAQFEWGISKNVTASTGLAAIRDDKGMQTFATAGLRTYTGAAIFTGDVALSNGGGWLAQVGTRARLGKFNINASHTQLHGFTSELFEAGGDQVKSRQAVAVSNSVSQEDAWRVPVTLELKRDALESGKTRNEMNLRASTRLWNTSLTHTLQWQSMGGYRYMGGMLDASRRAGDFDVTAQLGYSIKPEARLHGLNLGLTKRFDTGYSVGAALSHTFTEKETRLLANLTKTQGRYGYGVQAGVTSTGKYSLGLQFFTSFGANPRTGQWHTSALSMASTAAVSVAVAGTDEKGNVVPLPGVGFLVNGAPHQVLTDAQGMAFLDRLPANQMTDIVVNPNTVEDPRLQPNEPGLRVYTRPGQVASMDFPMTLAGDLDGRVLVNHKGAASLQLELVNDFGRVVQTATTADGGYYTMEKVPVGRYQLRLASSQTKAFDGPVSRQVYMSSDKLYVSNADFSLTANFTK